MDASFIVVEVVPSRTPFGLDQLRRTFKTSLSAAAAIAAAPAVGTVDETFPFMFLMPINAPESAESATRIDLVYQGCMAGDESPTLPDQKHDSGNAVQSASSSKASTGGTMTSPATIQYYAPSNTLTYFTFGAAGTTPADTPAATPTVITWTVGDTSYSIGNLVSDLIDVFFSLQINQTITSTEVVPGQYWQNVATTTVTYVPFIFDVPSGPLVTLASPGDGYHVGDSLSISSGGEGATITVLTVGGILGGSGILSFSVSANTFTVAHTLLPASGGFGTGAKFNVTIIP